MFLKMPHSLILLLACSIFAVAQIHSEPVKFKARVSKNGTCFSDSVNQILQLEAIDVINSSIIPQLYGQYRHLPANSCADIYEGHPSGHYWLSGAHGPQLVYCSLNENRCCNDSHGKWMRVTFLNMSDPSAQCPDGWREVESPIRTCRRKYNTSVSSVNYTTYGIH